MNDPYSGAPKAPDDLSCGKNVVIVRLIQCSLNITICFANVFILLSVMMRCGLISSCTDL